jgi:hypothetical protein
LDLLVLCFRLKQETVASEHKSKVMDMLAQLESEKEKLRDVDSELQRGEQTACKVLERIEDVRGLNTSVLQEVCVSNNMVPYVLVITWYHMC